MTAKDELATTPEQHWNSILGLWRSWLDHDLQRGARAELKRCADIGGVMCHPAALRLYSQLQEHPWRPRAEAVGVIAGVAPSLKRLSTQSTRDPNPTIEPKSPNEPDLPVILGQSVQGDRPRFSELRFKRLLESRDSNELLQQLRRALAQVDGAGNWIQLVNTITQCHRQWATPEQYSGSQQWQYQWSRSYYKQVFKYLKEVKS